MIAVGIDTAGRQGGVAIVEHGRILGQVVTEGNKSQGQRVLPALEWLIQRVPVRLDTIDFIGVSTGPGSFTGLRVGVAAAKSLAWAIGKPVVGVPSLQALCYAAASISPNTLLLPLLDARNGAVHAGFYAGASTQESAAQSAHLTAANTSAPNELHESQTIPLDQALTIAIDLMQNRSDFTSIMALGEGWLKYEGRIRERVGPLLNPAQPFLAGTAPYAVASIALENGKAGKVSDLASLEPTYQSKGVSPW